MLKKKKKERKKERKAGDEAELLCLSNTEKAREGIEVTMI